MEVHPKRVRAEAIPDQILPAEIMPGENMAMSKPQAWPA
jgi:hypothetical protein